MEHNCETMPIEVDIEKINNEWIEITYIKKSEEYHNNMKTIIYTPINSNPIKICPFCNENLK